MRLGGRIAAAIEVLNDILERRTPATLALRDWGKSNRYAGSKDRSAIGNIVFDVLRAKLLLGWMMDDDSPRALVLGLLVFQRGLSVSDIEAACAQKYGPGTLSKGEVSRLGNPIPIDTAPPHVQADVPEWLWPAFENNFGDEAITEGAALATRPPLDLRTNTLKITRDEALEKMEGYTPAPTLTSPLGIRFEAPEDDSRLPNIQSDVIYLTGEVEIQDEGSQIVSLLVDAKPGEQVLDYCAGGGGKTLALAAQMNNEGQVHAYDVDKRRLSPLVPRMQRAGATNIEIHMPPANLRGLEGRMDRVVVDAPCTGTGTWRRKPDAKWRLTLDQLERRVKEQQSVLAEARRFPKVGGFLFYITCSVLAEENEGAIYKFLEANPDYQLVSAGEVYEDTFGTDGPKPWSEDGLTVTLTPASTNTDGFFFAVMERIS